MKNMEYIYSAMVLHSAGKDITEDAIKAVLTAAGVDADAAKIKALVASLEGVNIEEAIASAAVAAPAAAAAAPAAAGGAAAAPAAAAAEPEEETVSEEEAAAGLSALFG
jgi:large subunit ribosomal protein L12